MQQYILIHYGEIYLKGANRKFFEDQLISNIRQALLEFGSLRLKHVGGRIIIMSEPDWDYELIETKLKQVFGIEYIAFAYNVDQNYKKIEKAIGQFIKDKKFQKFRITTRRTNKKFPTHSHEIDVKIGDFVRKKFKKKVDLENFDLNIHIDIVREYVFIYFDKIDCRGGLPVGVSGKLICLISGGIDSPVAANLMQKRGAEIIYVNFDSYPATPQENREKVKDLVKVLNNFQFKSKLYLVPFLDIQKQILKIAPEDYRVIFYRRMMYRLAAQIAQNESSLALVSGESLGQVASQTIENIYAISQAVTLPVLRPLIGTNKEEVTDIAKLIGTYDISIQPFTDCCSLYIPKHPVTHADLNLILNSEKKWRYQLLLKKTIKNCEIINY